MKNGTLKHTGKKKKVANDNVDSKKNDVEGMIKKYEGKDCELRTVNGKTIQCGRKQLLQGKLNSGENLDIFEPIILQEVLRFDSIRDQHL